MARLARWAVAGLAHYVTLDGHNTSPVFSDDADRQLFIDALKAACAQHRVALHALALPAAAAHLVARPESAADLSAMMQTLGRRFVAAYNQRHGRSGTPWNGRFRAAPLEPGETTLQALLAVDATSVGAGVADAGRWGAQSAGLLADPPEMWALGNTPFERERAYAARLEAGVGVAFRERLVAGVRRGLPVGSDSFLASLQASAGRVTAARPRGRPSLG